MSRLPIVSPQREVLNAYTLIPYPRKDRSRITGNIHIDHFLYHCSFKLLSQRCAWKKPESLTPCTANSTPHTERSQHYFQLASNMMISIKAVSAAITCPDSLWSHYIQRLTSSNRCNPLSSPYYTANNRRGCRYHY